MLPLAGGGTAAPLIQTQADEHGAQFSPDGKWIAYVTNTSGQAEVYVQPFPDRGSATRISVAVGAQIRWRADGRELFYVARDGRLMAVPIQPASNGQPIEVGVAVPLFATKIGHFLASGPQGQYIVSADGQRFLMNTIIRDTRPTPLRLIVNWRPQRP